jgi:hypothetical protein
MTDQTNAKPWWRSRTIIGALVVLAAQGARLAGWDVDTSLTTDLAIEAATIIGGLLAWFGRVRAEAPISRKQVAPGVSLPIRSKPDRLLDTKDPVQPGAGSAPSRERKQSRADKARSTWLD